MSDSGRRVLPIRLLLQMSWRNVWRQRRRNAMIFIAILGAVATIVLANSLIRGWQVDMVDSVIGNFTGHVKVLSKNYQADPSMEESFPLAADWVPPISSERVQGWTSRVRVPGVILSERETRGVELLGIDPAGEEGTSVYGDLLIEGDTLKSAEDRRVLVGKALAERIETTAGRRIVLMSLGADGKSKEAGFRVAGIFDAEGTALEKAFVITGRSALQSMLGGQRVTEISIRLFEESDTYLLGQNLKDEFPNRSVLSWDELQPQAAALFRYADFAILIWFAIMMTALAFGLVNTLVMAVLERVKEIGMLQAVGMKPFAVLAQVIVECLMIVCVGVAMGLALGVVLVAWFRDGIDLTQWAQGVEALHVASVLVPRLFIGDLIMVACASLFFGLLASAYPAWRAVKITPLEAMRR